MSDLVNLSSRTLVAGDIQYLTFYLYQRDPITLEVTPYDLSNASSINFYLRKYGSTIDVLSLPCEVVSGTLGICRVLATIPLEEGSYYGRIKVYEGPQEITWTDIFIEVTS